MPPHAAAQGSNEILRILLNAGAKIPPKIRRATRAFSWRWSKSTKQQSRSCSRPSSPPVWTSMRYESLAAANKKPEVAKVLLAHVAQFNARTNFRETALHYARGSEVEALLRQHGAE